MFGDDLDPICANFAGRDPNLFRVLVVKISKGIYCAQKTYNFLGVVLIWLRGSTHPTRLFVAIRKTTISKGHLGGRIPDLQYFVTELHAQNTS